MNTVCLAFLTLSLLAIHNNAAQAHDSYYYKPQPQYLQLYDPYYELHQIHYQLYLQRYHPYFRAKIFAIRGWPKEIRPWLRARQQHIFIAVRKSRVWKKR